MTTQYSPAIATPAEIKAAQKLAIATEFPVSFLALKRSGWFPLTYSQVVTMADWPWNLTLIAIDTKGNVSPPLKTSITTPGSA